MDRYLFLYDSLIKLYDQRIALRKKPFWLPGKGYNMKKLNEQIRDVEYEMTSMENRFCDALPMPIVQKLIDDPKNTSIWL
jgi:hypothetical protein